MKYNNNNELFKIIDNVSVVSFDIFDTLILRPFFKPEDLFLYIEEKYNIKNFYKNRIEASNIAYSNISNGEDVNIDRIYECFNQIIHDINKVEEYKQIEINEELSMCFINKRIYDIYKYAIGKNKDIIFISDMYLPNEIIVKILEKNGIKQYRKLYLSNEYTKLKRTGNLFKVVLNDLKIKTNNILHIGDNYKSDYIIPKRLKIKSYYVPKYQDEYMNTNFYKNFDSTSSAMSNYRFACAYNYNKYVSKDYWFKFGYEIAGPICLNFVKWIISKEIEDGAKNIIFIARDGYLLQKIYNKISLSNSKTYYLYSPRSLNLLCQLNYDKSGEFTYEHIKTIIDFYRSKSEVIKNVPEIKNTDQAICLMQENKTELEHLAQKYYENYSDYINSNINNLDKTILIDSVSKFFSAQMFIQNCLKNEIKGLYYLIQEGANLKNNVVSYSPIAKYAPEDSLIEFIMTSNEPPISSIYNGKVIYNDISKEEAERIKIFNEIKNGVLQFVDDIYNPQLYINNYANHDSLVNYIYGFINCPTALDKTNFKNVKFAYDTKHQNYHYLYPDWYSKDNKNNILKRIFSIRNEYDKNIKRKIITILGIRFKFKIKNKSDYQKSYIKFLGIPIIKKRKKQNLCKYYLLGFILILRKEVYNYEV